LFCAYCIFYFLSGSIETFSCDVKFSRAKFYLSDIPVDLDILQDKIESTWPHFKIMNYSLFYCHQDKNLSGVSSTQKLRELVGSSSVRTHLFKVKKECLGFSEYCDKKRATDVLDKLGASLTDSTRILELDNMFVLEKPEELNELIDRESRNIQTELLRRRVISLSTGVSEYTKREFISPVLIGSLHIVDGITMMCEKRVIGTFGNGPVDYTLIYKNLNIVLTEAKKEDLEGGLMQNLVQQKAYRESLAYALFSGSCKDAVALPRQERKRKVDEISKTVAQLPSFGIVTNGHSWIFSKIVCEPNQNRCRIYQSSLHTLLLHIDDFENLVQLQQINKIVTRIVAICLKQKEVIDTNEALGDILQGSATTIAGYESGVVESWESIKKQRSEDRESDEEDSDEDD
jgi:hypothetical protein